MSRMEVYLSPVLVEALKWKAYNLFTSSIGFQVIQLVDMEKQELVEYVLGPDNRLYATAWGEIEEDYE